MIDMNIYRKSIPMIEFDKLRLREGTPPGLVLVPEDDMKLYDRGLTHLSKHFHTPSRIIRIFTKTFRKVWMQLPEKDRSTLKKLWEPTRTSVVEGYPSSVVLLGDLKFSNSAGICEMRTGILWFDIQFLNDVKPTAIAHLIAHELGHAISIPHGWFDQHDCPHRGEQCVPCEVRAYSYMAAWGFDPFFGRLPMRERLNDRFKCR